MLPLRAADVSPSIDSPRPRGERSPPRRLWGASAWSASARPWTWAGLLCLCVFALGCQTGRGVIDDRWMGPWYAVLDGATRLEVETIRGERLLVVDDPEAIADLIERVEIDPTASWGRCRCSGEFALLFSTGQPEPVVVTLNHRKSLRLRAWSADGVLTPWSRSAVLSWLTTHGLDL